jgi:cellobiose dehydrogenase (acceptor)
VLADRLSATGKPTLLLEAGTPSTYASGGREAPAWIRDPNEPISRFDVPGFFGAFSEHPDGYQCPDIPFPAGCVLGGGAAVNSGIWFMPAARDWERFLPGWRASDMESAMRKARGRIPGTVNPSLDGKVWFPESFEVLGNMAKSLGWTEVDAARDVDNKERKFSRVPFSNIDGERAGPLGTYFLQAHGRSNFEIVFGARVERVVRVARKVTKVEFVKDGKRENVDLGEGAKVVLCAGAFGSSKILWQSGVGTRDQLEIVKAAKGHYMIDEAEWLDLPIGYVDPNKVPQVPEC